MAVCLVCIFDPRAAQSLDKVDSVQEITESVVLATGRLAMVVSVKISWLKC